MITRVLLAGVSLASGAVLLAGCSGSESIEQGGGSAAAPSAVPTPSGTPPGTPSASPGGTPEATPTSRPTLRPGAKGEEVRALQERLTELSYDPGKVDGKYGPATQMAVWAFQKVNRIKPSSTVGARFWSALDAPRTPGAVSRRRERDRVDIDLRRQLLVVHKAGRVVLISHISSGSGEYYCARDFGSDTPRCRYAVTSIGDFRTGRRVEGWDPSPLGQLYNPVYFNGGIAVHGYPSVPRYPASHGCVRVPMSTSERFQKLVGTGVPVHVRRSR